MMLRRRQDTRRAMLSRVALLLAGLGLVAGFLFLDPWSIAWLKGHTTLTFERSDRIDARRAVYVFDLGRIGDRFRYDPVSLLAFRPGLEEYWDWPEHPEGGFTICTNERGFREDGPTALVKSGTRILVAGDSHTAGLVGNDETFCSVLEARLRAVRNEPGLEVLDAGVAFTGPTCYLGTLRKNLELAPDVFVAVVFTGNDFWDDLKIRYVLDGWSPPAGDEDYRARLAPVAERWSGPLGQGYNQLYRWAHFPWEPERALECVEGALREASALCAREGIAFLVAVLPTKMDVEPEDDAETQLAVAGALGLGPSELEANQRLGARLIERLRAAGVACVDLLGPLREGEHPLYWRTDYHLGLAGHALVARVLEDALAEPLAHVPVQR